MLGPNTGAGQLRHAGQDAVLCEQIRSGRPDRIRERLQPSELGCGLRLGLTGIAFAPVERNDLGFIRDTG